MKIVRDYLTSQELNYIINAMLEKETALEREIVKIGMVVQLVGEDLGEFEDCNDIYDKVVADDKINLSVLINNYDIIDKLVAEELSINKVLKNFVNDINKKIDEIGEIDLNNAITQLKEIAENKEDIADGNKSVQKSPRSRKKS